MLSLAFTLIKLAIQTGSCKALRLEGCSVHVLPKSFVVATARLPPRLSRIFSINTPGSTSATCASVVFVRAKLCRCHVFPRSLLYIMPALGTRVASINWIGKTKVPSCIVMPRPGPCNRKYQDGSFTWEVILIGSLHVLPSSSLFTSISWAVSSGVIPGMEFHQARSLPIPCVHAATTQIVLVFSSTKIDGSPTPFCPWGRPSVCLKVMATRIGSQVCPLSVLRLTPISIFSCRSTLLL